MLTEINDGGYECLWFPFGRFMAKEYLRDGWNVIDQGDINRIRDWLVREGHRIPCQATCRHVRSMQLGLAPYDASDPRIEQYRWVSDHLPALEKSGLVAWDFSRLINVARWGYTGGIIDQKKAWKWILEASLFLQKSYTTWEELGEDFLLGFTYWADGKPPDDQLLEANQRLKASSNSLWQRTPWNLPLSQ